MSDLLDRAMELLPRKPKASFSVAVVDHTGDPVVLENQPFCFSGEPMPTHYWLVGHQEIGAIGRVESAGGVNEAEASIDAEVISQIHQRYAQERDRAIAEDYEGHRPSGGVGGTARGVKCLHAHYANLLATGNDEVGEWTRLRLLDAGDARENYRVIPSSERQWWKGE